jgi:hypothetical protein
MIMESTANGIRSRRMRDAAPDSDNEEGADFPDGDVSEEEYAELVSHINA